MHQPSCSGDTPHDPARDPPETRVECQCVVKVMSRCTHKVLKEVYDEVRRQLRDGRAHERPSRSRGRQSANKRHEHNQSANQCCSKSPNSCRSHHSHRYRPSNARSGRNSGSGQRCDHLYRPSAAHQRPFQRPVMLSTAARSALEAMHVHAKEGVKSH